MYVCIFVRHALSELFQEKNKCTKWLKPQNIYLRKFQYIYIHMYVLISISKGNIPYVTHTYVHMNVCIYLFTYMYECMWIKGWQVLSTLNFLKIVCFYLFMNLIKYTHTYICFYEINSKSEEKMYFSILIKKKQSYAGLLSEISLRFF